ncbi:cytochrome P450 3A9-like [Liolophura sinensis]|uniref:cytochrome P450 3A9-like n=1 Tax=Liolophura sinensis TaxID=3198878 RepID=UPI0031588E6C
MPFTDALSWIPTWAWCLVIIAILLYLYGVWPYLTTPISLPGPKPTPFVGNLLEMNAKGILDTDAAHVKTYGRCHVTWIGRRPLINIADPDIVKQICIKEFPKFVNRPVLVPLSPVQNAMVSVLKDDHWKFVRSILSPAFSSGKMRKMVPLIQICLDRLTENLTELSKSGKSFEVKSVMGGLSMEVIGAVGFGIETDVQKDLNDRFLTMAKRVFEENALTKIPVMMSLFFPFLKPIFQALDMTADSKDVTDFFATLLNKTISERRQQPSARKDLLQLILDSSVDDLQETLTDKDVDVNALKMDKLDRNKKLTDTEVVAQAFVFLLAGFDTTAAALSFFAYNLAVNPECQEKLIQEIDDSLQGAAPTYDNVMTLPYLEMCLSETQRLYPAVRGTSREASEPMTINGVYIPTDSTVILMNYILQHDEAYWPDPKKFDPERWSPEQKAARNPYVYFPFGIGPRNCVGTRLAQMEAKMAVVSVLQKFRFVRGPETEVPLKLKKGNFIQAENGVWLRVQSRD